MADQANESNESSEESGQVWATRSDGARFGVVAFGADHPRESLRGRWHVLVARPGRAAVAISGPVSQERARELARAAWRQWQ